MTVIQPGAYIISLPGEPCCFRPGIGDVLNNGTLIFLPSEFVWAYSGVISGSGDLVAESGWLWGVNTYSGNTTIRRGFGEVALIGLGTAGNGEGSLTVNGSFNIFTTRGGDGRAFNALFGDGIISVGRRRLTLGTGGGVGVFSGNIRDHLDDPRTGFDGGGLTIAGGSTTLTGTNTYSGVTVIHPGARLQIGDGGTGGTLGTGRFLPGESNLYQIREPGPGPVVNDGVLVFDRSDSVTVGNAISGRGMLVQAGAGTTILTGANGWTGGTIIAAGSLQIGTGGTAGSLGGGDVLNNGRLIFHRADPQDFGGAMAGTGALELRSGVLTVTGTLGHTGGTSVAAGARLNIGQGSFSGSLAGDVANAGTLAFSRAGRLIVPGVISGPGSLVQNGPGELVLTGLNTYTGPTLVQGGTLLVNGSIAESSALVLMGGRLGGSGTLPGLVVPAGSTLAPGNSIGTIRIAGDLTLARGSITEIEFQGATADRILVSGVATLDGTLQLQLQRLAGAGRFHAPVTILEASRVTGDFAARSVSGSFGAGVLPVIRVGPTQVQFELAPASLAGEGQAPLVGPARNLSAAALALDNAKRAGGDLNPFFNVYDQPASRLDLAVNQLSGEVSTTTAAMGFASGEQFLATLLDPLGTGRESMMGGRLRLDGDGDGGANRKAYAVWGTATGAYNRTTGDASDGSASRTTRTAGFALGFDHLIGAHSMAGVAIAVGESSASLASGQGRGMANFGQIGAYGGTRLGSFTLAGAGAFTFMDADTKRNLYFLGSDQQRAGFNAQVYSLRAEVRQDGVLAAGFGFQPVAAIQWQQVNNQGYAESSYTTGRALGVVVTGQSQASLRTELGGQVQGAALLGALPVQGFLRAAWAYYLTRDASMAVGFASLPNAGFTVRGARADANAALVAAGLEMPIMPGLTLGARVESEFSGNVTQVAGTMRLRYSF